MVGTDDRARWRCKQWPGVEVAPRGGGQPWQVWHDGRPIGPQPANRAKFSVRDAAGRWRGVSLSSLIADALPREGAPIPGFRACYRLVDETGDGTGWEVVSWSPRGRTRPGLRVTQYPHSYDERPMVNLWTVDGRKVGVQVARLVCLVHHGPPSGGMNVCRHLNGDRFDSRPENLAWGSDADNVRDREHHRRTGQGRWADQKAS